ncbi:MAG: hypothetical protein V8S83_06120 [Oscillospiraceae bacterium]
MRKKIMTLMMGMLLLLTACGQAKDSSASTMLPVAAVQSAVQAIVPVEDKTQEDTERLPAGETGEEAKPADGEEIPKPAEGAETPSGKTEETPQPTAPEEPATPAPVPEQPTTPEQPVMPAPQPEPAPSEPEEPTPEPVQEPEPEPAPKPAASGEIYSIAEAVRAGNEYARVQYGVTIDTSMTAANSSFFPGTADSVAWLAENGGQAALTAAVRGNVDATFACLAAMDGAEAVSVYARFNCTVRYDAASDEYIVVVLYG